MTGFVYGAAVLAACSPNALRILLYLLEGSAVKCLTNVAQLALRPALVHLTAWPPNAR
jgi:hypothetical protein